MTVSLSGTAVKSQKKEDLDAVPHPSPTIPLPSLFPPRAQILGEVYPGLVQPPSEAGFQVMLQFSIDAIEGDKDEFAKKARPRCLTRKSRKNSDTLTKRCRYRY